ncbi:MAG: hotdog family protein [Methylobacillus sp.]|jgi:predicted hotdog family 3-hydroxylacyl-ACP dehydratase|nr:hotdog family protein [Methylobacillus sp.]
MKTLPDIALLVPHAPPMRLLDRLIQADDECATTEVRIRPDSLFCTEEGVGGWVGIEYMAQSIAAHAGYTAHENGLPIQIGFLLGARQYTCYRPFFPQGSLLRIQVKRLFLADNGTASYACTIIDENQSALAEAALTVYEPPRTAILAKGGQGE